MRSAFALPPLVLAAILAVGAARAGLSPLEEAVRGIENDLYVLYKDLHQHPELSLMEEKTAAKLAGRLRALGYAVTTGVGGHGVVGLLRNGPGPTLMLRTDMDALPVREETGLPYASRVVAKNDAGEQMPVMHACGHDLHMATWIGTATLLARSKERWQGTLLLIAQPAEEKGDGAKAMLKAGLFTRFPKPEFALAIHDSAELPAGKVGYTPGFALANVDSVDIQIFGKGGHGAYPHRTVDPVVIAARIVLGLQSIVARERDPLEPAVITVGAIHGGTKHNVIPDTVQLLLTVRSYSDAVRRHLLAGIRRTAAAEAEAAAAPRPPQVVVTEGTPATYNDPALSERVATTLRRVLGADRVVKTPPVMGGEDFSEYGRAGVPTLIYWVGAVPPGRYAQAQAGGPPLPSLHSPRFAPDYVPAIRTGVVSLVAAAWDLLAPRAPR